MRLDHHLRTQAGRTLIELLVAIALGLLILLGVGSLFLGANQSTRTTSSISSAEESAQIALTLLGNAIKRAGYSEIIGTGVTGVRGNLLYSGPILRGCSGVAFNNPAGNDFGCTGTGTAPDTLAVWFQSDSVLASPQAATEDCLGNAVAANAANVTNADYAARLGTNISVIRNVYFVNGGNLQCLGNGNATAQTLVTGVEDFRVYYGFDDTAYANAAGWALRPTGRSIRDAADLRDNFPDPAPGISRWDFVVSVHVCVLVRTEETGVVAQAGQTYARCPQSAAQAAGTAAIPTATSADGRLRRAYSQVFTVRSRATPTPAI
jgi:type IV pilus assembly protein PilW